MELNTMQEAFVNMIIESWRFAKTYAKMVEKMNVTEKNKYVGRYNWYMQKLVENAEKAGLKIKEYQLGEAFDPGMAVTSLNMDEFEVGAQLIIEQMMEPIIVGNDGHIIKSGTVMLRRA